MTGTVTVMNVALFGYGELLGIRVLSLTSSYEGLGGWTLHIQVSMMFPSDEDIASGFDTYCLVNDDHGIHFGGVESMSRAGTVVVLILAEAAAAELRTGTVLELRFPTEPEARLAEGHLVDLLGGTA